MNAAAVGAIAGAISGTVTGLASSLAAPYVKHLIARREGQDLARRARVDSWRSGLAAYIASGPSANDLSFRSEAWFLTLHPHLSNEAKQMTSPGRTLYVSVDGGHAIADTLRSEIDRIEGEWKLN
jgi:hypothetical protein